MERGGMPGVSPSMGDRVEVVEKAFVGSAIAVESVARAASNSLVVGIVLGRSAAASNSARIDRWEFDNCAGAGV